MPKPLPHPLVSFFAGAVADAFVFDAETVLRASPKLPDDTKLAGILSHAQSVRRVMKEQPGTLVALGQDLTPEGWAAVDAFVDDLAVREAKEPDGGFSISAAFARKALGLSRDRFVVAIAGALLQEGGFRVDD